MDCTCGSCEMDITAYKFFWKPRSNNLLRKRKAGIFIFDPETKRVVLVQSRGNLWGCPKGSLNPGEQFEEGAVREVKEETGLDIDPNILNKSISFNSQIKYFYIHMNYKKVNVQNFRGNDANSVGWFHIQCIKNFHKQENMKFTKHTKMLFNKLLGITLE